MWQSGLPKQPSMTHTGQARHPSVWGAVGRSTRSWGEIAVGAPAAAGSDTKLSVKVKAPQSWSHRLNTECRDPFWWGRCEMYVFLYVSELWATGCGLQRRGVRKRLVGGLSGEVCLSLWIHAGRKPDPILPTWWPLDSETYLPPWVPPHLQPHAKLLPSWCWQMRSFFPSSLQDCVNRGASRSVRGSWTGPATPLAPTRVTWAHPNTAAPG